MKEKRYWERQERSPECQENEWKYAAAGDEGWGEAGASRKSQRPGVSEVSRIQTKIGEMEPEESTYSS